MKTKNKDWIASFNDVLEDMLPKTEATLQPNGSDNRPTR